MKKSIAIKAAAVMAILGAALFVLAGTASATTVKAEIDTLGPATAGETVDVQVSLRSADDGLAVADTLVTVYTDASFGGVSGEVELGKAVTDENGIAVVSIQPRSAGEQELRVQYLPPGDTEPQVITTSISVSSAPQLHKSAAGVQIPGLNVWLIMGAIGLVWSVLLSVGLRVLAIARAGADVEPALAWTASERKAEPQTHVSGAGR